MGGDQYGLRMQLDVVNQQERHLKHELKMAQAMQDADQVRRIEERLAANDRTFHGIRKALKRLTKEG